VGLVDEVAERALQGQGFGGAGAGGFEGAGVLGPQCVEASSGQRLLPALDALRRLWRQMPRKIGQKPAMAVGRDGANPAHDGGERNRLEEAQPDERRPSQPAGAKVRVSGGDLLVKPAHKLMELPAHTANQPVSEARQLAQHHCRTRFSLPVGLPERQENNSSLCHGW